ncbi:hypothetical protein ACFCYL_36840, partial [Streptomyces sp. NPDC056305]
SAGQCFIPTGTPFSWTIKIQVSPVSKLRGQGPSRGSPKDRHINFLGRYLFNIKASGPGQGLRPFRDPDAAEDGDDEDG